MFVVNMTFISSRFTSLDEISHIHSKHLIILCLPNIPSYLELY